VPPIDKIVTRARERGVQAVNIAATMQTNPVFARAMTAMSDVVLGEGEVDRRIRELAILRMGWNCQSVYEFGQHTLFGRDAGLTDAEIYATTRPLAERAWSPVDVAVLHMTDELYVDDCVTDATWVALEAHFTHANVIELMATALWYRLASALLNACGVQREDTTPGWPAFPLDS
jgi:alkylhydroperoxidase family enzyme